LAIISKLTGLADVQTIWQELYSAVDSDKLAVFLRRKYGFDEYVIKSCLILTCQIGLL